MDFYISKYNNNKSLEEQYNLFRESIGNINKKSDETFKRYDIKEEIGTGYIEIYTLINSMQLIKYDLEFYQDIHLNYSVDSEYFEIEYCIDGSMNIFELEIGRSLFKKGDLSISTSKDAVGTILYSKKSPYKGISITTRKGNLKTYFGSTGIEIWDETIEKLDNEVRHQYYRGIQVCHYLRNIFTEVFSCSYTNQLKRIFLEAKIMEILTNIISVEMKQCEDYLDSYEIKVIKKVPALMMSNLFELPTIDELSKELGINKNILTKGFKEIYGDSIFSYHRKKCLEKASIYLKSTDKSVHEIAFDIGYSNPSNFCYAFKRYFGLTPKEYRQS